MVCAMKVSCLILGRLRDQSSPGESGHGSCPTVQVPLECGGATLPLVCKDDFGIAVAAYGDWKVVL